MSFDLPNTIEKWFRQCGDSDDIEFVRCGWADAYAVIGPSKTEARPVYVYATKPSCILEAKWKYPDFNVLGLIARIGLPNTEDVSWIRNLLGQGELMFLGDLDPVDLMIFAWLRAHLNHAKVTYLGISDRYLNQLRVVLPETFIISCAASEQRALSFLDTVLPDLQDLVGPNCAALLDCGSKIELEAVVSSLGPPGPLLLPALRTPLS